MPAFAVKVISATGISEIPLIIEEPKLFPRLPLPCTHRQRQPAGSPERWMSELRRLNVSNMVGDGRSAYHVISSFLDRRDMRTHMLAWFRQKLDIGTDTVPSRSDVEKHFNDALQQNNTLMSLLATMDDAEGLISQLGDDVHRFFQNPEVDPAQKRRAWFKWNQDGIQAATYVPIAGQSNGELREDWVAPQLVLVTSGGNAALQNVAKQVIQDAIQGHLTCFFFVSTFKEIQAAATDLRNESWANEQSHDDCVVGIGRSSDCVRWKRFSQQEILQLAKSADSFILWAGQMLAEQSLTIIIGDPVTRPMSSQLQIDLEIALLTQGCVDAQFREQLIRYLLRPDAQGECLRNAAFSIAETIINPILAECDAERYNRIQTGAEQNIQVWVAVHVLLQPTLDDVTTFLDTSPTNRAFFGRTDTYILLGHGHPENGMMLRGDAGEDLCRGVLEWNDNGEESDEDSEEDIGAECVEDHSACFDDANHGDHAGSESSTKYGGSAGTGNSSIDLYEDSDSQEDDSEMLHPHVQGVYVHPHNFVACWKTSVDRWKGGRHLFAMTCHSSLWTRHEGLAALDGHHVRGIENAVTAFPRDAGEQWAKTGRFSIQTVTLRAFGQQQQDRNKRLSRKLGDEIDSRLTQLVNKLIDFGKEPGTTLLSRGCEDLVNAKVLSGERNFFLKKFSSSSAMRVIAWPADQGDCYSVAIKAVGEHQPTLKIVIDGGMRAETFAATIWPHLQGSEGADLTILTHMDADHIRGLKAWAEYNDAKADVAVPMGMFVANAPHNSVLQAWKQAEARSIGELNQMTTTVVGTIALSTAAGRREPSVFRCYRGQSLRIDVYGSNGLKRLPPSKYKSSHGLSIDVLHPTQEHIHFFYDEHPESFDPKSPKLTDAPKFENTKISLPNLVGAVFLLRLKADSGRSPRRCLFCGDAAAEDILTGIEDLVEDTHERLPYPLDLLTVPHHGSKKNYKSPAKCQEFFEKLPAKRYIVSSSGKQHGHPHESTLQTLASALKTRLDADTSTRVEVLFTYTDSLREARRKKQKETRDPPVYSCVRAFRKMLKKHNICDAVTVRTTMNRRKNTSANFVKRAFEF